MHSDKLVSRICSCNRDSSGPSPSMISFALLFALTFASILNLLPIQSVGNFGTVELPFVWVLMRFGIAKEISIVAAFSLHLIILLYCIPLGVYGLIKRPRRSPKDEIPTRKRIRPRSDKP